MAIRSEELTRLSEARRFYQAIGDEEYAAELGRDILDVSREITELIKSGAGH